MSYFPFKTTSFLNHGTKSNSYDSKTIFFSKLLLSCGEAAKSLDGSESH